MRLSGVEFFDSRSALEKARSIDEQLATAEDVVAVFVLGRKFREHGLERAGRLSRLILPHPEAESVSLFASSVEDTNFAKSIVETTRDLRARYKTDVKWSRQMVHYSMMLGDAKRQSGWVQLECALPYSRSNLRPSITIKRRQHEGLVVELDRIFERMWVDSEEPDPETIIRILSG